ncbi:MAG TPA: UDP-glucose--hexose-1-phosphate uridylyltransferase [Vicinamibacterales bacterium]|nr:UDP-glucose--hexose-1-phosphate uridylyltransferase [Vicinamibacterales bacterium]
MPPDPAHLYSTPHRRFDPLRRQWVLVSPHRTARPWQGQVERPPVVAAVAFDPACYLCPGNPRAGGARNPEYTSTFAFDNDFAALLPSTPPTEERAGDLLVARAERGVCRVVCFAPRHDLTLALMELAAIRAVVDTWVDEYLTLTRDRGLAYALVFENRGEMMGASNPHPHSQIWATETVPNEPARERVSLAEYKARHGSCLLCDYVALERARGERIVCENEAFVALVPFWAVWPFETIVVSRRHVGDISALDGSGRDALADILRRVTTRYDNVFEAPFPYSMGFHQEAPGTAAYEDAHLHAHFYPPLLRSATIRKFMVGFELLGSPQRDVTPETAAERLRGLPETHYTRSGVR